MTNKLSFWTKKVIKWTIVLVSLAVFGIILREVFKNEIIEIDTVVFNYVSQFRAALTTKIFKGITFWGGPLGIGIIIICMFLFTKDKKYVYSSMLNLSIVIISNRIIKTIVARPRPNDYNLIEESGYSFPSGHSMASLAFYGLLIYFAYKNIENKYIKNSICAILSTLIFLIGLSRVYLRVHYFSDVVGGFLLTAAYLVLFITIWINIINKKGEKGKDETTQK